MYDKFISQAEQFFKPFEEIIALQTQTLEAISQRQSELMSGVWDDSLSYAQKLAGEKSVDGFVKSQKDYLEGMQTRMRSAAEESFEIITASNDKIGSLWQESLHEAGAQTQKATKSAAKKASSTAKSAASSASSASKTASKKTTGSASNGKSEGSASSKASGGKASDSAKQTKSAPSPSAETAKAAASSKEASAKASS